MPRRTERQRVAHCLERGSPLAPTRTPACVRSMLALAGCTENCDGAPPLLGVPSPTTALHRHHGDGWAAAARGAMGEVQYRYYNTGRPTGTVNRSENWDTVYMVFLVQSVRVKYLYKNHEKTPSKTQLKKPS